MKIHGGNTERDIKCCEKYGNRLEMSVLYVSVTPSVMQWLRKSMGFTIEDVGRELNISTDIINRWENGDKNPTFDELESLAELYKRPITAFYLSEPQEEPKMPTDYRKLSKNEMKIPPNDVYLIRKAQYLQETCNELIDELEEDIEPHVNYVSLSDDPQKIADLERKISKISSTAQKQWRDHHEAFKIWRGYLEERNILVFQFPFEGSNIRGLLLKEIKPYVILLNSKEHISARIFTLFHEYGHILLKESESSICFPEEYVSSRDDKDNLIERWCDTFAGSFLMPKDDLLADFKSLNYSHIRWLSNKYKVSKQACLTRLLIIQSISWGQYIQQKDHLLSMEISSQEQTGGRGETKADAALREKGSKFCSIVMESGDRNIISTNDVLDFLDIKLRNYTELRQDLAKNA